MILFRSPRHASCLGEIAVYGHVRFVDVSELWCDAYVLRVKVYGTFGSHWTILRFAILRNALVSLVH